MGFALGGEMSQFHPRADPELGEDVPQVGINGVRGQEKLFAHLVSGGLRRHQPHPHPP
jgi:hypothetical protein